jgi:hypothetical protein
MELHMANPMHQSVPTLLIHSKPLHSMPRELRLKYDGGWVRVSIEINGEDPEPIEVGMDLCPHECRRLARVLVAAAAQMDQDYPELARAAH